MALEYVTGDLLKADLPAIAHGCNCVGKMGAGIALPIRNLYPEMYDEYRSMCEQSHFKLGSSFAWRAPNGKVIFNLATQFQAGRDARLSAIDSAVRQMIAQSIPSRYNVSRIGLPRIGAGIGGLKWEHVEGVLLVAAERNPHVDLIVYTLPQEADKWNV